ncbi:His-Xaa-Ser system radical SAM maturase HxsB [Mesorhizobium sp. YIM 152430]|uniref:His-Xaa-Ser system radical SAM maturase HxsB n=1 Tax=Mesorhizobium sp. YIM 152430 TaxID=3031761 RepID=UPI0023DB8F5B|nr:His-Xaa-Ser system radical SAM maturase HxsB [Mesorhizobium sp. YIM 152430]MDF1600204.1 His-Xaa-Ser system radical SAM maturase HxsB [Mesorhizobium sp. YIM 152430]
MIRSTLLDADGRQILISNDFGDYAIISNDEFRSYETGSETALSTERLRDLEARGLAKADHQRPRSKLEEAAFNTRKSFALEGPSLHIFVVTLRCDHSCQYCQVSRANLSAPGFDMTSETAALAVDRVFESPSSTLTIEFQGGEPALRFDLVRRIVELAENRNLTENRTLSFAMVSTLHHFSDDDLAFCRDHEIRLSTSIDGPSVLHDRNRPNPDRNAWLQTVEALDRARAVLGHEGVSALPTITREGLSDPRGLVDQYRDLGFPTIFLRPISPYGFALKTRKAIGYRMEDFLRFYDQALDYILELNANGEAFEETYAAILLRHILTPFHSGYLDLRSPTGTGLGVLVYNYDGRVFPADEARMAAQTGDQRFTMGTVADSFDTLMASPAMQWLMKGAVSEHLRGCRDCAFVPYCGSDPVFHATVQGDPAADRRDSEFCQKHMHIFRGLFRRVAEAEPETMRTFIAWAMRKPRDEVHVSGWVDR